MKKDAKPEKLRTSIVFDPDVAELIRSTMKEKNLDSLKDVVQTLIKKGELYNFCEKLGATDAEDSNYLLSFFCEEGHMQHITEDVPTHLSELMCVQNPALDCKFTKSEKQHGGFTCPLGVHKEWRSLIAKYLV